MKTPVISVLIFIAAAFLGAVGQHLYKAGADRASGSVLNHLTNSRIAMGSVCYVAVLTMFIVAFKKGFAQCAVPGLRLDLRLGRFHRALDLRYPDQADQRGGNGIASRRNVPDGEIGMSHESYEPMMPLGLGYVEGVTRNYIRRGTFKNVKELIARIERFVHTHDARSKPFGKSLYGFLLCQA